MKLALLVKSDALVDNLGQHVYLLSKFDLFAPDVTVHFQLLTVFARVDQLDLLHALCF